MLKRFNAAAPTLCFELTDRCDMSCPKCITSSHRSETGRQLTLYGIKSSLLLPYRFAGGKRLIICGGEPTLSEKLPSIIECAISLRLNVFLASNLYRTGRPLLRRLLELMDDRAHTFMFSYDSIIPEEMKRIRGVNAHRQVTENIHSLLEIKERLGSRTRIAASFVLHKENAGSAAETLKFLVGLKLHKVVVQPANQYGVVDINSFSAVSPPYGKTHLPKMLKAIDTLFSLGKTFPEIQIVHPDRKRWIRHFTSPTAQKTVCKSRNFIFVDSFGNFRGCNNSKIYANLEDVGVVDFHASDFYKDHLSLTNVCNICLHSTA